MNAKREYILRILLSLSPCISLCILHYVQENLHLINNKVLFMSLFFIAFFIPFAAYLLLADRVEKYPPSPKDKLGSITLLALFLLINSTLITIVFSILVLNDTLLTVNAQREKNTLTYLHYTDSRLEATIAGKPTPDTLSDEEFNKLEKSMNENVLKQVVSYNKKQREYMYTFEGITNELLHMQKSLTLGYTNEELEEIKVKFRELNSLKFNFLQIISEDNIKYPIIINDKKIKKMQKDAEILKDDILLDLIKYGEHSQRKLLHRTSF